MDYFTSDFHFNHAKPFVYEKRGFTSPAEMNEAIIERYNSVVKPEDTCYVLGDLCMGGADALDANKQLIERLNGKIVVIRGNHDSEKKLAMYRTCHNIIEICDAKWYKYGKYHFFISHFPALTSNWDEEKPLKARAINLCGHSHTTNAFADIDKGPIYHCEVDAHNCTPVSIDEILEQLHNELTRV